MVLNIFIIVSALWFGGSDYTAAVFGRHSTLALVSGVHVGYRPAASGINRSFLRRGFGWREVAGGWLDNRLVGLTFAFPLPLSGSGRWFHGTEANLTVFKRPE
jgi:hypothetical protein